MIWSRKYTRIFTYVIASCLSLLLFVIIPQSPFDSVTDIIKHAHSSVKGYNDNNQGNGNAVPLADTTSIEGNIIHSSDNSNSGVDGILRPSVRLANKNIKKEIDNLRSNPSTYRFDWENWVDTNPSYDDIAPFLTENNYKEAMDAISYVKNKMPPPARVIILSTPEEYTLGRRSQLPHEIYEVPYASDYGCIYRYGLSKCDELDDEKPKRLSLSQLLTPTISENIFEWDTNNLMQHSETYVNHHTGYRTKNVPAKIKAGLEFAKENVDHFDGTLDTITKYDKRFFRFQETKAEATETLKLLLNAWSDFAMEYNINYWIAQGSILGYLWNGYPFPWDTDVDVHMPIHFMHKLSQFNGSLLVHSSGGNNRSYFLDINPAYVSRDSDGKHNTVDAKLIDTSNGASLDIAAVAKLPSGWEVGSKANDAFRLTHFNQLRVARFAGSLVYIPRHIENFIKEHYPFIYTPSYKNWTYSFAKKAWIDTPSGCQYPIPTYKSVECSWLPNNQCYVESGVTCAHNDLSEKLYYYASVHEQEMELWDSTPDLDEAIIKDPEAAKSMLNLLNKNFLDLYDDLKN